MHIFRNLIPLDAEAAAVGAENRIGSVFKVGFGIVCKLGNHLFCIVTVIVAGILTVKPAPAACVCRNLRGIAVERGHRSFSLENGYPSHILGRLKFARLHSDIVDRPAYLLARNFKPERIPRFKKLGLSLHKSLSDRPIGRLTKISALGMLYMRPACGKRDLHIGYRRSRQHAEMLFFSEVHQNKPLPVSVKRILTAIACKFQSASPRQRFHYQMHFRIVSERLIVSDSLHGVGYRFLIHYPARINFDLHTETLIDNAF